MKTKKIGRFKQIACFMASMILVLVLCILPTFADAEQYPTVNEDGLSLTETPFLTMNFAVSGENGIQDQGFYRIPFEILESSENEFDYVIASGRTFAITWRDKGDDTSWWTYRPEAQHDLVYKIVKGPRVYEAQDPLQPALMRYTQTLTVRLYCDSGTLYWTNGFPVETSPGVQFTMSFSAGVASYIDWGDGTSTLVGAEGYRNGYFSDDKDLYQRAPLGGIRLDYPSGGTQRNEVSILQVNFFLPYSVDYPIYNGTADLRLGALIDAVNFDYNTLPPDIWDGTFRPAWYLTFGEDAYDRGYIFGKDAGYDEGHIHGYNYGHAAGVREGWDSGLVAGYDRGLADGIKTGEIGTVGNLITGIFEGLYNIFNGLLDFNIPVGNSVINFAGIVGMIIALLIVIIVVRFILR